MTLSWRYFLKTIIHALYDAFELGGIRYTVFTLAQLPQGSLGISLRERLILLISTVLCLAIITAIGLGVEI